MMVKSCKLNAKQKEKALPMFCKILKLTDRGVQHVCTEMQAPRTRTGCRDSGGEGPSDPHDLRPLGAKEGKTHEFGTDAMMEGFKKGDDLAV